MKINRMIKRKEDKGWFGKMDEQNKTTKEENTERVLFCDHKSANSQQVDYVKIIEKSDGIYMTLGTTSSGFACGGEIDKKIGNSIKEFRNPKDFSIACINQFGETWERWWENNEKLKEICYKE